MSGTYINKRRLYLHRSFFNARYLRTPNRLTELREEWFWARGMPCVSRWTDICRVLLYLSIAPRRCLSAITHTCLSAETTFFGKIKTYGNIRINSRSVISSHTRVWLGRGSQVCPSNHLSGYNREFDTTFDSKCVFKAAGFLVDLFIDRLDTSPARSS